MNNQAKIKLEKIKKLKLPEKVRATADKIEQGLSSADAATQKKAEDALNKLYTQIKAVAAKQREEKTEKEVNEKTIVPQNSDIAAPEAKKELTKKTTVADDVIDKALKNDPELAGFGRSDKRRDAGRKALPAGRRVARKGWSNQFGKSDGGRVYYENRENRKDRKSPAFKQGYPFLAKGGKIHPMDDEDGTFYVNLYKTKGDQMMSVDEREYSSKASAMTYAMMKRDFMKEGESIFVMNDDGDVLYTSIGTKKMAMGGKFPYQNAQVGDSARVILDNKMGTIMVTYGRRFHLKFPDGTEKTYSAEELEFYPDDNVMAKGGELKKGDKIVVLGTEFEFVRYEMDSSQGYDEERVILKNENGIRSYPKDMVEAYSQYEMAKGGYMAKGGSVLKPIKILIKNLDGKIVYTTTSSNKAADYLVLHDRDNLTVETEDGEVIFANGQYMADGGYIPYDGAMNSFRDFQVYVKQRISEYPELKEEILEFYYLAQSEIEEGGSTYSEISRGFEDIEDIIREQKMAKGGYMAEGENYEYVNTFKRFDSNVPVPDEDFKKLVDAYHKQLSGDKLAVSKYKVLKLQMGNYLGHKTVEEMEAYIEKTHNAHKMAKGGYVDIEAKLIKELQKLQRDLNSNRLNTYREGDNSDAEKARQRERESKLVRFNEILELLRENDAKKMAKGGTINKLKADSYAYGFMEDFDKTRRIVKMNFGDDTRKEFEKIVKSKFSKHKVFEDGGYMADGGAIKGSNPSTGEKFGVVIGSLKKEDGLTTLTIRSSYSARIKSYELTFDEKGFLRSIGDFGHTIDGTYPDMKGGHLSVKNVDADNKKESIDALAKITSPSFAKKVYDYVQEEKMAKGGPTGDYTNRRDLKLIVIKNPNKSGSKDYLTIDKKDFLDGLHKFEGGGSLSKGYTYIKRADVNQVAYYDKNGKTQIEFKPKNGFWVSKKALVDAGMNESKAEPKKTSLNFGTTSMRKTSSGWIAKNKVSNYKGYDWEITTMKSMRGDLVSTAVGGKNEKSGSGYTMFTYVMYQDPNVRLITSKPSRITEKVTLEQQEKALKEFETKVTDKWYADGGKIGFEALSKKVASRYAGKKVQPKYQGEYGKTYDKAEAKEVGDKVAAKVYRMQQGKMAMGGKIELPYELDKYFTKPAGTIEVEMSKLIPIRARKEGIENAEVYMKKAYDGKMSKRKPIEIYKTRNKKYRVNDGNSTYAVAKKNGWETIYATVVSNPNVSKRAEKSTFAIAKEIRKEGEKWSDAVKRVKENRK